MKTKQTCVRDNGTINFERSAKAPAPVERSAKAPTTVERSASAPTTAVEYIFYETDSSFDYLGPFGVRTYKDIEAHGFSIELTKDDVPLIETLDGFGDFWNIEQQCKTLEDLNNWIYDHIDEADSDTIELLFELQSFIQDELNKPLTDKINKLGLLRNYKKNNKICLKH